MKKILQLPEKLQMLIHEGRLPTQGAIDLLDSPQESWGDILATATAENGKVNSQKIRSAVRESQVSPLVDFEDADAMLAGLENHPVMASTEDKPATTARAKPRSMAELRKFIAQRVRGDKQEWEMDPAIETFLKVFSQWLQGRRTDDSMDNALNGLLEAEVSEVSEEEENEEATE